MTKPNAEYGTPDEAGSAEIMDPRPEGGRTLAASADKPVGLRQGAPILLDLFCSAGGAAMGYHRAGFDVVGVDINPQPRYPFRFIQADVMQVLPTLDYDLQDAIHASPPCQDWSAMKTATKRDHVRLIEPVRQMLQDIGLPYVIENVERAPLRDPWTLCGTMFGLRCRRHRQFEVHPQITALLPPCNCKGKVASGELLGHRLAGKVAPGRTQPPPQPESARLDAYGVPWMTGREARQAVPPAYTEWIGRHLMGHVTREAAAS